MWSMDIIDSKVSDQPVSLWYFSLLISYKFYNSFELQTWLLVDIILKFETIPECSKTTPLCLFTLKMMLAIQNLS